MRSAMVSRFYFHLCSSAEFVQDEEGTEAADFGAAYLQVPRGAWCPDPPRQRAVPSGALRRFSEGHLVLGQLRPSISLEALAAVLILDQHRWSR